MTCISKSINTATKILNKSFYAIVFIIYVSAYLVTMRININVIYKYILFILISYDLYQFMEKYLLQHKHNTITMIYFTKISYCRVVLVNKLSKDAKIITAKILTQNHICLVLQTMDNNKNTHLIIEKNSENSSIFHKMKFIISNK